MPNPTDRTPLLTPPQDSTDSPRSDRNDFLNVPHRRATDDPSAGTSGTITPTAGHHTVHTDRRLSGAPWVNRLREIFLFTWALLATAAVIVLAVWAQHHQDSSRPGNGTPHKGHSGLKPDGKRNLVFMVSDGMGPASLSLTRSFRQFVEGREVNDTLVLDRHFWGTSRTRSTDSLVTDSAAGATAFSCGEKSYNGAIAMLPGSKPCGTVLEAAKRAGYVTGLVVTTDVTDATPACFASHVDYRLQNDEIALQEIGEGPLGRVVDLVLGGGRCRFLPNTTAGSCRQDDVDVVEIARKEHGWNYFDDRAGFDSLWEGKNISLPTLGLFASYNVPFEIDRRKMSDKYPSLSEMAKAALVALEKATEDSDKGFFLMIEGSRIDHAGHFNDPAAQVREVLEYDRTFKLVADFLEDSKTQGLLVATSDHETGGLATALQNPGHLPVYNWYPSVLAKANASAEYLSALLSKHVSSLSPSDHPATSAGAKKELKNWINNALVVPYLGIKDASDEELDEVAIVAANDLAIEPLADMVSRRARIGWSTHGHTAVDVNIYSSGGEFADAVRGNVENTDVGRLLRGYLDVDVGDVTKELRNKLGGGKGKVEMDAVACEEGGDGMARSWVPDVGDI